MALAAALVVVAAPGRAQQPTPTVHEHVEVRRVEVDARVIDAAGRPIEGLSMGNFAVWVDGISARLETVEWVSGLTPYAEGPTPPEAVEAGTAPAPEGRLVVLLFQADFERSRLTGFMRMKSRALKVVEDLAAADRVAIVSFDSHLKLRVDFTGDRAALARGIHDAILLGIPEPVPPGPEPSLAAHWDYAAARDAATPEMGLLVLGRALQALPGPKALVFLGWGLGELGGGRVSMRSGYSEARAVLVKARVSVYAIDVTDADFHTLEVGLVKVAEDTGGFYVKTNLFPDQAVTRIEGAIAGHYTLVFECPAPGHGEHHLAVELVGVRKGRLLASPSFQD